MQCDHRRNRSWNGKWHDYDFRISNYAASTHHFNAEGRSGDISVNTGATLTNGATSGGGISFTDTSNQFIGFKWALYCIYGGQFNLYMHQADHLE